MLQRDSFNYYERFTLEIGCYVIIKKTFFNKVVDVISNFCDTLLQVGKAGPLS